MNTLTKLVVKGGVLVITCSDDAAYLAELIRRLLADIIIPDNEKNINKKVSRLSPIFTPHLKNLKGMSRRTDDWIIDNIINPASSQRLFTIADALNNIQNDFDFYASSPHFVQDWRWYKDIHSEEFNFKDIGLNSYWKNIHNLIDYRYVHPPRDIESNKKLYQLCRSIREHINQYEHEKKQKTLTEIITILKEVITITNTFSKETAKALNEALSLLKKEKINDDDIKNMKYFAPFFGRGQQYLSFIRIK